MKLAELKGKKIHWDMTPQDGAGEVFLTTKAEMEAYEARERARVGFYFYVDVWDMTANLWVMENKVYSGRADRIEDAEMITEDELYDAIEGAGGAINRSGHYPISHAIKRKLKKALDDIDEVSG